MCSRAGAATRRRGARSPTTGPGCYRGWPRKPSSCAPRSSSAPSPTTSIAAACAGAAVHKRYLLHVATNLSLLMRQLDAAPAPPGATLKGGGSRTTGGVKALARCASTHLHDATVRRTALRGRPARRPARRDAGRITSAGQRRRRPRKAALRVAFPVPSGRRERSAMPRHRRHAPDCRGNGKRDPTCRRIVQGSTGIARHAFPSLSADIRRAAPTSSANPASDLDSCSRPFLSLCACIDGHRVRSRPPNLTGSTICWRSLQRTVLAVELGGHDFEPFGLGFLHRHLGLGRAEVVAPPTARRPGRHQSLNVALGKRRDLVAVGIAVVRQHRRGPAENGRDRRDVRHQLIAVAGAVGDPGAHDQLRAPGIHHGLSVIGLAVLVLLALAHQPAVRIEKALARPTASALDHAPEKLDVLGEPGVRFRR